MSLLDKLIYNDLYPEMESVMSNSDIGALKNKKYTQIIYLLSMVL